MTRIKRITAKALPLLVAAGFVASLAADAGAASVLSLFRDGVNSASDDDREYLIDRNINEAGPDGILGTVDDIPRFIGNAPNPASNVGQLDVGDSLAGMFGMNALNGAANVGGLTPTNEWTGIFQARVKTKTALPGGFFVFDFEPDPAFEATYGLGAFFVFYEDATNNYTMDYDDAVPPSVAPPADLTGPADGPVDDGTVAGPARPVLPPSWLDVSSGALVSEGTFMATAMDGNYFWTLGWKGPDGLVGTGDEANPGPGEGWNSITTGIGDNVLNAFNFSTGVVGATFNIGLSLLAANAAVTNNVVINPITAGAFGPTEFAASGSVRGVQDLDTPWEASSNFDLAFNATIPEPGAMILLGTGLLGLGYYGRRRKK